MRRKEIKSAFAVAEASIGSGLGPHLSSSTLTGANCLKDIFTPIWAEPCLRSLDIFQQPNGAQMNNWSMATDIRRMSREDLDRLNAEGKAWRERNKPAQDQSPEQAAPDAIQTTQLDLWEKLRATTWPDGFQTYKDTVQAHLHAKKGLHKGSCDKTNKHHRTGKDRIASSYSSETCLSQPHARSVMGSDFPRPINCGPEASRTWV